MYSTCRIGRKARWINITQDFFNRGQVHMSRVFTSPHKERLPIFRYQLQGFPKTTNVTTQMTLPTTGIAIIETTHAVRANTDLLLPTFDQLVSKGVKG